MFTTSAYAQAAGEVSNGAQFMSFVPFILIFVIMYFLIIRPQRVQMKKRQEMLNAVRRGDSVVTGGGIIGKVTKVYDESDELEVEIGDDMRIRIIRSTLTCVRVKGEPLLEEKSNPHAKKAQKNPKANKAVAKERAVSLKEEKAASKEDKPSA
ncbi:preprotein translocase subunit YajC [Bartonella sp. A05]|uniref:preprotein translocase subunit YajC n=1 Tax=Bartonella sp. A05 TaxID=2967261 RepID=UPI0022A90636|nr:preprotein translocase subunit YajC [Bartonella sp. A05]MCZ2203769.1 preprotein translocase subunit YajC [Bartonella sp. A05]